MRISHNVTNTVTTPVVPHKTNIDRDEFVIRPKPMGEAESTAAASSTQSSLVEKTTYSPDEIDQLPQRYIFNSDIKCSVCPYRTKVRTNLVRHLQFHSSERAVPQIAPVNPVPCLDKNEKMFDKMTNLALSSFAGSSGARMGGGGGGGADNRIKSEIKGGFYVVFECLLLEMSDFDFSAIFTNVMLV